ncbi:MAG: uroporphyrinogen-III synthase [Chlorobi bacterium OLB7]|nr:MAG: uroporphyrinogen-III synthase [Chlorobi bacterium OLB7]
MPSAILTRSHQENRRLAPVFRRRGFRVFSAPMIELLPIPPDASITQQWLAAGGSRVVLSSAAAAQQWLAALPNLPIPPDSVRYWIVGQRSRDLVQTRFPNSPIEALANSGAELLRQIPPGLAAPAILYPCSSQRRDELVDGLRDRGARVMELPLYRPQLPANAARRLRTAIRGAGVRSVSSSFPLRRWPISFRFNRSYRTELFSPPLEAPPPRHCGGTG